VKPETRERVEAAIRELGYRPNRSARSLVRSRTESIGVISMGGPGANLLAVVMRGVFAEAAAAGLSVTVANVEFEPGADDARRLVDEAFDRLVSEGVDGMLLVSASTDVEDAIRSKVHELPIVLVFGEAMAGAGIVTVDPEHGGSLAGHHLLGLGHTVIAHVGGPADRFDARGREAGFRAALAERGLTPAAVERGDWSSDSGYRAGLTLRERHDITAVFVANDEMALGLLHALAEAGRRVPEEVSVVGYDDNPDAAHYRPPLTTVRQDLAEIGRRSVRALTAALETGAGASVTLEPELVVRASTRPVSPA